MEPYHYAWLSTHPERSEEWLALRLKDGFNVHHIDGNHGNDEPSNLVLIEVVDHFRIHGIPNILGRVSQKGTKKKRKDDRLDKGLVAYQGLLEGRSWSVITGNIGTTVPTAQKHAYEYAKKNFRPWPVSVDDIKRHLEYVLSLES